MPRIVFLIIPVLISILFTSCSDDYEEISKSEFIDTVLQDQKITSLEIENKEKIHIYTNENKYYVISDLSSHSLDDLVDEIRSKNGAVLVKYLAPETSIILDVLMSLLFLPLIIPAHIILLWIALRKIIKSEVEDTEKILHAIISIFFPFFGPIIYLTTKRKS
ncbi:MAG: hypothetical protein COA80_04370 [Leeuwenhoekiella sp.]|nr:MAG: hypothetical protein COA80_04370 [Leeuwenhoekiella sp.]